MKVWTLTTHYHHDGDYFTSVHTSSRGAQDSLYEFVCENWDNEIMGRDLDDCGTDEAVEHFFEHMCDDFSYAINERPLVGPMNIVEDAEPGEIFVSEEELRVASLGLQHVNIESLAKEMREPPEVVEDKVIEIAKKLG